jgi:protein SCO1
MRTMPVRIRLTLLLAVTIALVAAVAVVVSAGGSQQRADGPGFAGAISPAGVPPADFALRDQDGRLVRLADYRGRPVILTFLYTTCRDTCPVTAQQIKIALDDLHSDVPALAISVDPAQDTALNAKRFLVRQNLLGRMRFLLGSRAQLAPVWKAYAIQPQGPAFEHSARVVLLDGRGAQRVAWPVQELQPEGLAHDLRLLGA